PGGGRRAGRDIPGPRHPAGAAGTDGGLGPGAGRRRSPPGRAPRRAGRRAAVDAPAGPVAVVEGHRGPTGPGASGEEPCRRRSQRPLEAAAGIIAPARQRVDSIGPGGTVTSFRDVSVIIEKEAAPCGPRTPFGRPRPWNDPPAGSS